MKTIKYVFSFLVVSLFFNISHAHRNYLGHAPDRGVLITVSPDKIAAKAGDKVIFYGSITVLNKSDDDDKDNKGKSNKDDLLESFKKQGIDIAASFPSSATDVTSKLNIYSNGKNEIKFNFEVPAIAANDLNQFSVKVYNNHQDKELLKRLSAIIAKLERRILALQILKKHHEDKKSAKESINYIQKEIEKLNAISLKITQQLNSSEDLMAENTYGIQVDNSISSISRISTVMNKFRFVIESDPGTVIQGLDTSIKSRIENLRRGDDDKDDHYYERDDKVIADFVFNGNIIYSSSPQKLSGGQQISYEYLAKNLDSSRNNIFSIALYRTEKNKKKNRIGYLSQKIPVISDSIAPIWQTNYSPNLPYVKNMEPIFLSVKDSFGRINPDSLSAVVSGTMVSGASYQNNISSNLTRNKLGDGTYTFQGSALSLDEGDYILNSSVKDLANNFASPNPLQISFRIDRTSPLVTIALQENTLTNQTSYDVPISVQDISPTHTDIYVNEQIFFSTGAKQFNANVILNLEGNNIVKVISTDAAGNISVAKQVTIVRDTTPPVLSNLLPAAGSILHTLSFPISGDSSEALSVVSVNGLNLTLSPDGKHFSGNYVTPNLSPLVFNWAAVDIAGNPVVIATQVEINLALLVAELISINPDQDGIHLAIIGAKGAGRAGASI